MDESESLKSKEETSRERDVENYATSASTSATRNEVPNGGLQAWLQVAGGVNLQQRLKQLGIASPR